MKIKDLERLRELKNRILIELSGRVGRQNAIGMGELYEKIFGDTWHNRINDTRPLRHLIMTLRGEGVPICSGPEGYWLASAGSELDGFCRRLRRRAMKSLIQEAKLRKVTLPELLGQMEFDLRGHDEAA